MICEAMVFEALWRGAMLLSVPFPEEFAPSELKFVVFTTAFDPRLVGELPSMNGLESFLCSWHDLLRPNTALPSRPSLERGGDEGVRS